MKNKIILDEYRPPHDFFVHRLADGNRVFASSDNYTDRQFRKDLILTNVVDVDKQ